MVSFFKTVVSVSSAVRFLDELICLNFLLLPFAERCGFQAHGASPWAAGRQTLGGLKATRVADTTSALLMCWFQGTHSMEASVV